MQSYTMLKIFLESRKMILALNIIDLEVVGTLLRHRK